MCLSCPGKAAFSVSRYLFYALPRFRKYQRNTPEYRLYFNFLQDWRQNNYPEKIRYDELRSVVNAAWERISVEFPIGFNAGSLRSSYSNMHTED